MKSYNTMYHEYNNLCRLVEEYTKILDEVFNEQRKRANLNKVCSVRNSIAVSPLDCSWLHVF